VNAAQEIQTGEARIVLAGGTESMSQAPHVIRGLRRGLRLGQGALEDSLMVALVDTYCGLAMAQTAEKIAREHDISREAQDLYALRSHRAAQRARENGVFAQEIVPVEIPTGGGRVDSVAHDDHMRPNTDMDQLTKLPPAFGKDGMVTAGNASGIVDGAASVVVADEETVKGLGAEPLARVVAWAYVGVEPSEMGLGPVPAIRKVLDRAGRKLADIDLFEINEAFAGQYLAVEKDLGLDRDKVNVNGGAIAIGHPLGATGTRLLLTLALEMSRRKARRGIASACIGGGQGIATLIERP
jgi:acetyl-CoA acetyltransferase family protein